MHLVAKAWAKHNQRTPSYALFCDFSKCWFSCSVLWKLSSLVWLKHRDHNCRRSTFLRMNPKKKASKSPLPSKQRKKRPLKRLHHSHFLFIMMVWSCFGNLVPAQLEFSCWEFFIELVIGKVFCSFLVSGPPYWNFLDSTWEKLPKWPNFVV